MLSILCKDLINFILTFLTPFNKYYNIKKTKYEINKYISSEQIKIGLYYNKITKKYEKNVKKYFLNKLFESKNLINIGNGFTFDELNIIFKTRTSHSKEQMKIELITQNNKNSIELNINILRFADAVFEKNTRPGKWKFPIPNRYGTWVCIRNYISI